MKKTSYVLITPARNEEAYIEETIKSIIAQTIRPLEWIIVSDGSTDKTDEIVESYTSRFNFIKLVKAENQEKRNFGSKVNAFRAGYEKLEIQDYGFIGNLDADVTFDKNYFECLFNKFEKNPKLGLAGGIIAVLVDGKYEKQINSLNSVAGAVQLFRRTCYEDIGGYIPLKSGGIDSAAEIMARMKGWQVQTFPEYLVLHHRRVGSSNQYRSMFKKGIVNYSLGYHPIFQIVSAIFRMKAKPYITGSMCILLGYFWAMICRHKRPISDELVKFLRSEQLQRIGLK